jgi:16S rRNA (cytosine967-C5)-methyltransferase
MKPEIRVRLALIDILAEVLEHKRSLTLVLPNYLKEFTDTRDQALIQFCAYGICREFFQLDFFIKKLSSKPIKDKKIYYLLLIGLYQLSASRIPNFAVVNTLVDTAKKIKLLSTTGFINAILREFARQQIDLNMELEKNPITQYSHPTWLMDLLKSAWPDQWRNICISNNEQPPMWLRINQQKVDPKVYIDLLEQNNIAVKTHDGVTCCLQEPIDVMNLPNFNEGWVSVQDASAQYAAELLDLQPGQVVLDACAAPGGKTGHILEKQPLLAKLIALDKDATRAIKIKENLQRLKLSAEVIVGDAEKPATWWNNELFDRILIDAPCSATGVIRRHPDIKLLRQAEDIPALAQQQLALLNALWPLLKPNGKLVYATCSVLPQENEQVIAAFCQQHKAKCLPIHLPFGVNTAHGHQLFPGDHHMDGFFYTTLFKSGI